jgi:hypothetical protein
VDRTICNHFLVNHPLIRTLQNHISSIKSCEVYAQFIYHYFTKITKENNEKKKFWILTGRTFFIRVRELVFSDISTGWIGVFFGSLIAEECLSKYEIRNRPLLGGVCFSIFIGVPLIYDTFVL